MVALGELCDIVIGRTPARNRPEYWEGSEAWLSIADMNQGLSIRTTKERITEAGARSGRPVSPGTVLLSFKLSIGKVAIAEIPLYTNEAIAALPIKNPNQLDSGYLVRALQALRIAEASNRAAMGATLNTRSLSQVRIPLPSMAEQRRIAAILDQADALHAKRRQVLAHFDAQINSIFFTMFGSPMTPGRWPMTRLGDLARIIRGASPRPAGDPRFFGGVIPWLKISDITAEAGAVVGNIRESVTEEGRQRSVLLPPSTLVLTNSATVGVPKIIAPSTCIHDGFLAFLDISDDVDQYWLWAALAASRQRLVGLAPEGTQKNLNSPIVKAVRIGLPPLELQREFRHRADSINSSRFSAERAVTAHQELFASLQSRAFQGQL